MDDKTKRPRRTTQVVTLRNHMDVNSYDMKYDILSMNVEELQNLMSELKEPAYRATQIFEWLHTKRFDCSSILPFNDMKNLPKTLRTTLDERCKISTCKVKDLLISEQDDTHKYLFSLDDNITIESVRMKYSFGHSICISTQAGCRMGCRFCASAEGGLIRNLTPGEMCAQVYALKLTDEVPNIVLMGCGEPLDNFESTMKFLELISHPKGAAIGGRHITISTCGLIPEIIKLTDSAKLQINLAISLHGPDDATRKTLMPIANRYPLTDLMDACKYYIKSTNRRITFEYALIKGINDSPQKADALATLLKGILCHVNLIPVNENTNGDTRYLPASRQAAKSFLSILENRGINATIRRTIGSDVNAACGQLRAKEQNPINLSHQ